MTTLSLIENQARLWFFSERLLEQDTSAIQELKSQINYEDLQAVLQVLAGCDGTIMVTGAGTSGSIARRFAHLMTCSGKSAVFVDAGQCRHGYSAVIRPKVVLVTFSRGGETEEINFLFQITRNRGAKTIGIVENLDSTLASMCDIVLSARVVKENDAVDAIPFASTLAHAAVGDILCRYSGNLRP